MFPFFAGSAGTAEVLAARRNRARALAPFILLILAILVLTSCSALPGQNTKQPNGFASKTNTFKQAWDPIHPRARLTTPIIGLEISPATTTIYSSGGVQFTARVSGTRDVSVTWSATSGTISQDGWYAAPAGSALRTVKITAISVADPTVRAVATVVVTPQAITSAPVITSTSLPSATTAIPYRATLTASGGTPPYQWTLSAGSLPQGFQLNNSTGIISGSSNSAGSFSFTVTILDAAGNSAHQDLGLVVSSAGNCGPPAYGCSRTDLIPAPVPNPPPNVGNLIGANTIVVDPDFHNRIARVTDATTNPQYTGSFVSAASGSADENRWNLDSTLLLLQDTGTAGYPMTFDPISMQAARMYVSNFPARGGLKLSNGRGTWSRTNPDLLFQYNNTAVTKLDFTDRVNPPSPQLVYDFRSSSNCLGKGFTVTWSTAGGISSDDTVFAAGFSNNGTQGGLGSVYVAAYTAGSGCRVWNTQTGQITGDWGPTGTVTTPDRFTIHNVKLSKDGKWLIVAATHCLSTATGCPHTPYFWNIGTTTVNVPVGDLSGHWTEGYSHFVNNSGNPFGQFNIRSFSNPTTNRSIIESFPLGLAPPLDQHPSWNNVDPNDSVPYLTSTVDWGGSVPSSTPAWWDEILAVSPGSGTVTRLAHTFGTGQSQRFTTKYAIGSVSQDGKFFLLSSDWMGTLGSESGAATCTIGTDCRGDVFVVELK